MKNKFYTLFISYAYIGLTLFAFVCPVKFSVIYFIPGLILMWLLFFFYKNGCNSYSANLSYKREVISRKRVYLSYLLLSFIIFYPLYIRFYTGLSISTALTNVLNASSNYYLYQEYFESSHLNKFSFLKLPYILINGILKFLFISSTIRVISYSRKPSLFEIFSLFILSCILMILGLSRGTSFELFELCTLYVYALILRFINFRLKISKRVVLRIFIIMISVASFFVYNIIVRNNTSFNSLATGIDSNSFIYALSPSLSVFLFSFYGYFLFGLHFSSVMFIDVFFSSFNNFISLFIPHGIQLLNFSSYRDAASQYIDLGARWVPDMMNYLDLWGALILIAFVYLLGRFSSFVFLTKKNDIVPSVFLYFSMFFMLSLPIGNFITASSSNVICFILAFLCIYVKVPLFNNFFKID